MPKQTLMWGNWLSRRACHIGFKTADSFASSMGCTRSTVASWYSLKSPPSEMRKGFDERLARLLKVDRITLFVQYSDIPPETAPLIESEMSLGSDEITLRRKLIAIVELLGPNQLRDLHDKGRSLLTTSSAA